MVMLSHRQDITISELLGLKGPLINMIETVCWFILFNTLILTVFGFFPILCGKVGAPRQKNSIILAF